MDMNLKNKRRIMLNISLNNAANDILHDFYTEYEIESGDISPEQQKKWTSLTEQMADLMLELAYQNLSQTENKPITM